MSFEILRQVTFTHKPASGVPSGIRTPVTAVKGRCPGPLDEGDTKIAYHALRDIFV